MLDLSGNDSRKTFATKWSKDIETYGFAQVPHVLLRGLTSTLTPSEFMVLIELIMIYNYKGEAPYVSVGTLSLYTGMAKNTVRRQLRNLEAKRFIQRRHRTGQTNEYELEPLILQLNKLAHEGVQNWRQAYPDEDMYRYSELDTNKEDELNRESNNTSTNVEGGLRPP